jgi:coatomer subunit beta
LVCNNFRNDLLHPNEYVAGRALRLVASIQSKFILESLMESIVGKCLGHSDVYVRRNAVVCLAKIHEYYGDEFLPDLIEKLEQSLDKESDLTTKRNIFLLYFRLERDRAINYILEKIKEEDHESFGDILQLVVVRMVQEAMLKDRKVSGVCMRIIKEFSNSKFNSVLYEVASALIRYSKNPEALRSGLSILLQVLKNNNDNNVRLLILDQLEIIRKKDKLVIMDVFIDLSTLLFTGDFEIKLKFLPFMETYIRKENIGVIQKTIFEELKACLEDRNIDKEYQTKIILLVNKLVTTGIIVPKVLLTQILPVFLHTSHFEQSTFDVVRMVLQNIYQKIAEADRSSFFEVLKQQVQEIKSLRMCSFAVNMLGQHARTAADAQDLMGTFIESVGDLPLKPRTQKTETKTEETPQEKKYIRKTVIKSDGTYGEELVEETEESNAKENPEEVIYYKIRDFCIESEDFCLILSRTFARLLAKMNATAHEVKVCLGTVIVIVCEFIKYHQSKSVGARDRRTATTRAS